MSESFAVVNDFMKWTNNTHCPGNRFCSMFPLFELRDLDSGRNRKYQFQFQAFNDAGHFCEILSEDFSLPSPFPPTVGTVFDVEEIFFIERNDIADIDVSFSLNSYSVFLKDVEHMESLTYEIGVGLSKMSDIVIPLHPINGSSFNEGWYFSEKAEQLKQYQKYYVLLKVSSSGGSVSLSTDGFTIIDKKDIDKVVKVNDGQGCLSQSPVFKQNFTNDVPNNTIFTVNVPFPLIIGTVYTTFIRASYVDFDVKGIKSSLLSKSNNSFTFIPEIHQPVFTLYINWTSNSSTNSLALETCRCMNNIQVQNQNDIVGANWKINETLGKYLSHFNVSLMSCGKTKDTFCETVSSILITKEKRSFVFREISNFLDEGFYKVALWICFKRNCISGGTSDGFYVEANGPEYGSISAQLDLTDINCARFRLRFDDFHCSYPAEPFAKFYRWALFSDSNGLVQISDQIIHYNGTGKQEVCYCSRYL